MGKQKGKTKTNLHETVGHESQLLWSFVGKAVSTHELMLTTISDVVKQLIDAYEQGKEIDLNK